MAEQRKSVDWDAMEADWRAGVKPVLQLSKEYGVSRAAILKHWDKARIARDLTAKIDAMAESLVTQATVTQAVTTDEQRVTERAIVEANATVQANAILAQRQDVKRARAVVAKLFDELEAVINSGEVLDDMAAILASGDEGAMQKALAKVTNLPTKVDVVKKLSEAMKVQIELERKVLRIKDDDSTPDDMAKRFGAGVAMGAAEAYARMINGGQDAAG